MQLTAISSCSSCSCSCEPQGNCHPQLQSQRRRRTWNAPKRVPQHAACKLLHATCSPAPRSERRGDMRCALLATSDIISASNSNRLLSTQETQMLLQENGESWHGICGLLVAYGQQLSPDSMTDVCAAVHQLLHRSSTRHKTAARNSPCVRYPQLWGTLLQQARLEAAASHSEHPHSVDDTQSQPPSSHDERTGSNYGYRHNIAAGMGTHQHTAWSQSLPLAVQQELYEEHDDMTMHIQQQLAASDLHVVCSHQETNIAKPQHHQRGRVAAAAKRTVQMLWHVAEHMLASTSLGPSQAAVLALTVADAVCMLGLAGKNPWRIRPATLAAAPGAAVVCRLCQHSMQHLQAQVQPAAPASAGRLPQQHCVVVAAAAALAIASLTPPRHEPLQHSAPVITSQACAGVDSTKATLINHFWVLAQQAGILPAVANLRTSPAVHEAATALAWSQAQCWQPVDEGTIDSVLEAVAHTAQADAVDSTAHQCTASPKFLSTAQLLDLTCAVVVQAKRLRRDAKNTAAEQGGVTVDGTSTVSAQPITQHATLSRPARPTHQASISASTAGHNSVQPSRVQQHTRYTGNTHATVQAASSISLLHDHTALPQLDTLLHALLNPELHAHARSPLVTDAMARARAAARTAAIASGQHPRQPSVIAAVRKAARKAAEAELARLAAAERTSSSCAELTSKELVALLSLLGWVGVRLSSSGSMLLHQALQLNTQDMTTAELAAVVVAFGRMRTGMEASLLRSILDRFERQLCNATVADVAGLVWALPWVSKAYTMYMVKQQRALLMALVDHTLPGLQAAADLHPRTSQAATTSHAVDDEADSEQHGQAWAALDSTTDNQVVASRPAKSEALQRRAPGNASTATRVTPVDLVWLVSGLSRLGFLPHPQWLGAHRLACLAMERQFSPASKAHLRAAYLAFLKM